MALIAALAGTAVAQEATTSAKPVTKKKVKKIARKQAKKQINKLAPGLSVAHADTADNATNAENATNAQNAQTAETANTVADGAITAPKLGNVVARVDEIPLPANSQNAGNVSCQPEEQLIGGGARSISFGGDMVSSRPIKSDGADPANGEDDLSAWRAAAQNPTATATTFKIFAICLQ